MIIIAPYARALRNGGNNPKNYPHWPELIKLLEKLGEPLIQVGTAEEKQLVPDFRKGLPLVKLAELVAECKMWISVDSFFQHFCWDLKKKGIVIFSRSDPNIFGHPENVNLLKSRMYLREKQFWMWEQDEIVPAAYIQPSKVIEAVRDFM